MKKFTRNQTPRLDPRNWSKNRGIGIQEYGCLAARGIRIEIQEYGCLAVSAIGIDHSKANSRRQNRTMRIGSGGGGGGV